MNSKASRALHMAHYIKRNKPDIEWSICCEKAWFCVRVRNTLDNAIVSLWYQKTDGTWRKALGTRNMEFIPEAKRPKNEPMPKPTPMPNYAVIPYFDLQKQAWRSFSILQLFSMPDFWPLES